ncbi:MAG: hypothetical protein ACYC6G_17195 [Desulfobaccales bacterium]
MRALTDAMEMALTDGKRRPAYKLLAFDPKLDSLATIVAGTYNQVPFDLTPYATEISWSPAQISFVLDDPDGIFHPDTGTQRKYLANAAVVRLKEGDERVPESEWSWSFTGMIRGQIGWQVSRRSANLTAKVTVFSRENGQSFKRRQVTSSEYTVGTEIGAMLHDISRTFLGLSGDEIRIPETLGLQLKHKTNQLCQVTPWDGITTILETVGKVPYFDGDGRLTCYDKNMRRLPDRILRDTEKVFDLDIPERNDDVINMVRVIFLDSELTKVTSPMQKLCTAQVTTGFFSRGEKLRCYWSEDKTQRAEATYMRVLKSVNSGILPVGSESYRQDNEFGGTIEVTVSTWIPILATLMLVEYLVAAVIPDDVLVFNVGWGVSVGEGITISIGRILQAQAMIVIMLIMMSLGSAQYEVWGTPYDYAYLEQDSTAIEDGIDYWEQNKLEIKNDFVGSYEQADTLAITELIFQKSSSYPRKLAIEDDLSLEIGDILDFPDGRRFFIKNLSKAIKRGEIPIMVLDGFKVVTA